MTMASSSSGFGLAEKIARQLLLDSEDLEKSVKDFQETRSRGLQMQYDAYRAYEEEIAAIGYINEDMEVNEDEDVDHNMQRLLNSDMSYAHAEEDYNTQHLQKDVLEAGWDKILKQPRKPRGKAYLQEEKPPVPSMREKKEMREKLFTYLDDSRITEMRAELSMELAIGNDGDPAKIERMADDLFNTQKENAESLRDFMDIYQANPTGRLWGNDGDYMTMVKSLGAVNTENMNARRSVAEHATFHKAEKAKKLKNLH
jgi:hypothetical protein